MKEINNS